jgi:hypothetical protein
MKCIHCGVEVSEQEMRARYDELSRRGIVPMMITMCKECRETPRKAKTWAEWAKERRSS